MTALATIPSVTRGHAGLRAVLRTPSVVTLFSRRCVRLRARSAAKSLEYVPALHSGISMAMEIADMHHAATETATAHAARPAAGEAALLVWLGTARPGERFVYHAGHLAADRASAAGMQQELGRIADRVMALAVEGRVLPVQMRLANGRVTYLAIKATGRADRRVAR